MMDELIERLDGCLRRMHHAAYSPLIKEARDAITASAAREARMREALMEIASITSGGGAGQDILALYRIAMIAKAALSSPPGREGT